MSTSTGTRACRREAQAALVDHFRWRCTLDKRLIAEYSVNAPAWLRAVLPLLPLVYGRRARRGDRMLRHTRHLHSYAKTDGWRAAVEQCRKLTCA
jgi:hypothetical protein